jgi:hypothetical protein
MFDFTPFIPNRGLKLDPVKTIAVTFICYKTTESGTEPDLTLVYALKEGVHILKEGTPVVSLSKIHYLYRLHMKKGMAS